MKDNCTLITIGGYKAVVDPKGLIVQTDPKIRKLEDTDLDMTFAKYKKRAEFKRIEKVPYPGIVSNDVYKEMVKKNPSLNRLREKFECDIF